MALEKHLAADDPAYQLATAEGLALGALHVVAIVSLRQCYQQQQQTVGLRILLAHINAQLPPAQRLGSMELYQLFPGGIAQLYRVAGIDSGRRCM